MKIVEHQPYNKPGQMTVSVTAKKAISLNKCLHRWLKSNGITIGIESGTVYLADDPKSKLQFPPAGTDSASQLVSDTFFVAHPDNRKQTCKYLLDDSATPKPHDGLLFYPLKRIK